MKSFENYLIVADLDGTLYLSQNNIPKVNIEAINEFVNLNGKFTVATGRGIEAARFITDKVNISCPVIVNNGNTIYDYKSNSIIYSEYLPESAKVAVKDIKSRFLNLGIEVYSNSELFVLNNNDTVARHLNYECVKYKSVSIDDIIDMPWSKIVFADKSDDIIKAREYVKTLNFSDIDFVDTSEFYLEVLKSGVDKGTAIVKMAELLNIPHNNICAIGNYYNDLEMVKAAGIGAMVVSAPDELKQVAKYITKADCDSGAVAEFIYHVMSL